jgi:hypothetical protein
MTGAGHRIHIQVDAAAPPPEAFSVGVPLTSALAPSIDAMAALKRFVAERGVEARKAKESDREYLEKRRQSMSKLGFAVV